MFACLSSALLLLLPLHMATAAWACSSKSLDDTFEGDYHFRAALRWSATAPAWSTFSHWEDLSIMRRRPSCVWKVLSTWRSGEPAMSLPGIVVSCVPLRVSARADHTWPKKCWLSTRWLVKALVPELILPISFLSSTPATTPPATACAFVN